MKKNADKTGSQREQNRISLTMFEKKNKRGGGYTAFFCGFRGIVAGFGTLNREQICSRLPKSGTSLISFCFSKNVNRAVHIFPKRRSNQFRFFQKGGHISSRFSKKEIKSVHVFSKDVNTFVHHCSRWFTVCSLSAHACS